MSFLGNECSTTDIINAPDITLCLLLVAVMILVMLCLFWKGRKCEFFFAGNVYSLTFVSNLSQ